MSSPTAGTEYDRRVLIEVMKDGVPLRVNVWTKGGKVRFAFPPGMTESEAAEIVMHGLDMLKPLDVPALFRDSKKRRRLIET